ncbi:MAG: DHH family phosphoesterase [Kiloniellales bacterium]
MALGTVCDVVPLTGVNRALVAQGLKVMARRGNAGLAALADLAGLDQAPEAYHAGFVLGPRVNAGGRVGEAGLGARLLATDDKTEARRLAERLDGFNRERRRIEAEILAQAVDRVEGLGIQSEPLVFVAGEGWHVGVIGIVANRLSERYNRPACVVAIADGVGKGSGRSVAGLDLGAAVLAAVQAGLLIDGGGHPMAAGFTVAADRLPALRSFLMERVAALTDGRPAEPELRLDGALQPAAVTTTLVGDLARLGPFGAGNPQPRFALANVRILKADVVGDGHLRCLVTGEGGGRLKAIAFKAMDGPLGQGLRHRSGAALHLAGHLRPDNWRGREGVQLVIDDAAAA